MHYWWSAILDRTKTRSKPKFVKDAHAFKIKLYGIKTKSMFMELKREGKSMKELPLSQTFPCFTGDDHE